MIATIALTFLVGSYRGALVRADDRASALGGITTSSKLNIHVSRVSWEKTVV